MIFNLFNTQMNKTKFFKLAGAAAMQAKEDKSFTSKVKASFRMAGNIAKRNYNPSWSNIAMTILPIIYIISPIDIIPELFFGPIGLLDDFGILMFGLKYFNKEIAKYMAWEFEQQAYADVEDAKIIE